MIMSFIRKSILGALTIALATTAAMAQTWPDKPIRIIVPYPPGGVLDSLVRTVAKQLQESLRQPVITENIAGAGSNIGMNACARAPADGYTLCITTNDSVSLNPFLYKNFPYDPVRDLAPVQRLVWVDGVIVSTAPHGYKTLEALMSAAKARPDTVSWGSWGYGSVSHLYASWFNSSLGAQLLHVPYKGSAPLLQAMLSGEVHSGFLAKGILMQHIRSGKVIPLAATAERRLDGLPDVPTLREVGVDFYIPAWFGAFAPAGTPAAVVERLGAEIGRIVASPGLEPFMATAGFRPAATETPAGFAAFLREDRVRGERLVKASNTVLD